MPRGMSGPGVPPGDGAANDESALVARLQAGDAAAFETLVRTHGGHLLAVTRRFLRNDDDARDTVQDAFLSAFKSIDRFAGGAQLSTWLHRIAVNASLMKLRTRRRKPEEPIDELLPTFIDNGHHATDIPAWRESAESALQRRETRVLVRECIDRLPETYRTVLLLRDIEDLDTDETAERLGITPNAVKIRLHRARQALRTLLEHVPASVAA
jgi:RNA polymerase sigma-70 factor (ECF subfamily)